LVAASIVVTPSVARAATVPCTSSVTPKNLDDGAARVGSRHPHLKASFYAACPNVSGALSSSNFIYFWCWHSNSYGNLWLYGRVKGTETKGWLSIDSLVNGVIFTNLADCPTRV
jgi:hypothetical protein